MRVPLIVLRGTQPRRVRVAAHRLDRGEHDLRVRRQRPYRHLHPARVHQRSSRSGTRTQGGRRAHLLGLPGFGTAVGRGLEEAARLERAHLEGGLKHAVRERPAGVETARAR